MPIPVIESPPDAVDKVYAKSLFELAETEGGRSALEQLADEIEQLSETMRAHSELGEFFRSRIISVGVKERVLKSALTGRVSPLLLRFILVLCRKERTNRTQQIFNAFGRLVQERFGRVEVDLYTRHPLPADQLESIRSRLEKALKREPVMHVYTDAAMIGGIKMQLGDRLIDASIATRLRRMRELLIEDGTGAVRARYSRIVEGEE